MNIERLNNQSTTQLCYKLLDDKFLDKDEKIKEDLKFKINIPEFNIVNSKVLAKEGEKFDTYLFLLKGENRKGEGGLRTKGYFKFSYKKFNNEWWIVDFDGSKIKQVEIDKEISKKYDELPLITIITAVYNGEKYLEETIKSVINQTYPNVEYIIIDGGSTDGTLDIIKKYEDKIDYWVSERDNGIYDAWNKGVLLSFGKYISFLGADDFYLEKALDIYLNEINNHLYKNFDFIYSKVSLINKDKKLLRILGKPWNWEQFKKYMSVNHPGALHSRNYLKKFGLFDISFKIAGDYELLLRKGNNLKVLYIDDITTHIRLGGVSNTMIKITFNETKIAKIKNKSRNKLFAEIDKYIAYLKYYIRKFLIKRILS